MKAIIGYHKDFDSNSSGFDSPRTLKQLPYKGWQWRFTGFSRKQIKDGIRKAGGKVLSISSFKGDLVVRFQCKTRASGWGESHYPAPEFAYKLRKNLELSIDKSGYFD